MAWNKWMMNEAKITMDQPYIERGEQSLFQSQVIEGTTEEIAALLQTGAFAGQKLRVIVEAAEVKVKAARPNDDADDPQQEQHKKIDALAMRGPKKPRSNESWQNTVGKHSEDSTLNRIFDEGARIREAERKEQC